MRQFNLRNRIGEEYRLNSSDNFFHTPEGLGFRRNATLQKTGSSYKLIRDGFNQTPISGQIMFKSDSQASAYKRYLVFKNFLQEIPLTLVYRIPGGEFYMDVLPSNVDKTEINSSLGMDIGIELTPLTMWYRTISASAEADRVQIISDSVNESPCILTFSGLTVTNDSVVWSQLVDGSSFMTGKLNEMTVAATDKIVVRTDTNPYRIYQRIGSTNTGVYQHSDFETKRFPFIQKGVNEFRVSGATSVSVEGKILYETV